MSNAIAQRTQELGIRRALGTPDSKIITLLMKQGLWQLAIGTVLGLPIAFMFGNLIIGIVGIDSSQVLGVFAIIPEEIDKGIQKGFLDGIPFRLLSQSLLFSGNNAHRIVVVIPIHTGGIIAIQKILS